MNLNNAVGEHNVTRQGSHMTEPEKTVSPG